MTKYTTEAELRELVAQGLTTGQIAEHLGRPRAGITQALSILGISTRGHRVPDPKMPAMLEAAVSRLALGEQVSEIARQIGKNPPALYKVLRRHGLPTTPAEYLRRKAAEAKEPS